MSPESLLSTIGQTYLKTLGFYKKEIDGDWGTFSRAAGIAWWRETRLAILKRIDPYSATQLGSTPNATQLRILAAQIFLSDLGIYKGKIDYAWGPISTSAAQAWGAVAFPPPVAGYSLNGSDKPGTVLTPYDVAKQYIGTKEIPGKNHCGVILSWYRRLQIAIFDDETAWCSTFVNFCSAEAGYERTGKLNARSWLDVGRKIDLSQAVPGDVLIFSRGDSDWEGHVTFFAGFGADKKQLRCLGGNQNDAVNITVYGISRLLGVRRLRSLAELRGPINKI